MAFRLTNKIRALAATAAVPAEIGSTSGGSTATASVPVAWKHIRCRVQKPDGAGGVSPPMRPCRSPVLGGIRLDLSVACQAFATDTQAPVSETEMEVERAYKEGSGNEKGREGAPVSEMMPLDSVTMNDEVNLRMALNASLQALNARLQELKSAGVEVIMMDVWWGLVESEKPGEYDWRGYTEFLEIAKKHGLKVKAVMSFHQCGGNDGDSCTIPLPRWVVEEIDRDPDLAYTDQWGRRNYEYVSLGCDTLPVLKGRTPVQCYFDFMRAFRDKFSDFLGDTVVEIQVGMGPAGELRYPSYPEQNGTRKSPGIGAFQCYDKYMLSSLKAAAEDIGKPEWGSIGPTDWPEDTQVFRKEGGEWNSPYGKFFLRWYTDMLLSHGAGILLAAKRIFENKGVKISAKVGEIHSHDGATSHAA